jgi:glycosyltransferase involved in cell wall biosynthesis
LARASRRAVKRLASSARVACSRAVTESGKADLAVIVPAYRARYLGEALASLAAQTDQRFRVYVFDDASPDDLASVVGPFRHRLDLVYRRFEDNLGGRNLVAQWTRCIRSTGSEPWIWVFADDDIADPGCVAAFHQAMRETGAVCDLWRFNLSFIDANGQRFFDAAPHPEYEPALEFLHAYLFATRRQWRAADHIFSRAVFDATGGFVEFPNAIYSDHATWLKFAGTRGVRTIPEARLLWRSYGGNVTSQSFTGRRSATEAMYLFSDWLFEYIQSLDPRLEPYYRRGLRRQYFIALSLLPFDRQLFLESLRYANRRWPTRKIANWALCSRNYLRDFARRVPVLHEVQNLSRRIRRSPLA